LVTNGRVDYPAIQVEDLFAAYLRQLDRVNPATLSAREEQLAFWINAYNAFAIWTEKTQRPKRTEKSQRP
jgi:hypothetical protein